MKHNSRSSMCSPWGEPPGKPGRRNEACDCDLTVEPALVECGDFAAARQRYYEAENLEQLFK